MAILKVKDQNGNIIDIPAIKGDDYILTEADKAEIAEQAAGMIDIPLSTSIGSGVIE